MFKKKKGLTEILLAAIITGSLTAACALFTGALLAGSITVDVISCVQKKKAQAQVFQILNPAEERVS